MSNLGAYSNYLAKFIFRSSVRGLISDRPESENSMCIIGIRATEFLSKYFSGVCRAISQKEISDAIELYHLRRACEQLIHIKESNILANIRNFHGFQMYITRMTLDDPGSTPNEVEAYFEQAHGALRDNLDEIRVLCQGLDKADNPELRRAGQLLYQTAFDGGVKFMQSNIEEDYRALKLIEDELMVRQSLLKESFVNILQPC